MTYRFVPEFCCELLISVAQFGQLDGSPSAMSILDLDSWDTPLSKGRIFESGGSAGSHNVSYGGSR